MVVAEASGEMEARDQLPLRPYAPAGSVFERTLRRIGLTRDILTVTNLLRCRPLDNRLDGMSYESAAIRHCQPNLVSVYLQRKPRVILALGNLPFSYLAGEGGPGRSVTTMRGYLFSPSASYSSAIAEDADLRDVVILPTYHPSHIRRGAPELIGVFARDMLRAVRIAKGMDASYITGDPLIAFNREEMSYLLEPTLDEAWAFFHRCRDAGSSLPISYDLETYETMSLDEDARDQFADTQVKMIQFSSAHNQAIVFPWNREFREVVKAVLKLPNPKFTHNGRKFDNRVLSAVGERNGDGGEFLPAGTIYDTLDMWRRWQPDLPGNLQYVASFVNYPFPWKHLNHSQPRFYAATDADAGRRIGIMLLASMKDAGILDHYETQVARLHDIPAVVAAHGITISRPAIREAAEKIVKEQEAAIQEMDRVYPVDKRTFSPESGYKRVPKEVETAIKVWESEARGILLGERTVADGEGMAEYVTRLTGLIEREFVVKEKNKQTTLMETIQVRRWCRLNSLSANSRQQIIAYAGTRKHEIPKKMKDGGRVDSLTLEDIDYLYAKTGDRFYLHVGNWRRMDEERKAALDLIRDGLGDNVRIHPYFSILSAGGISGRNPTFPQLGSAAMGAVTAAEGRRLVLWLVDSLPEMIAGERSGDEAWRDLVASGPGWRQELARREGIATEVLEGFFRGMTDMGILDTNRVKLGTGLKMVSEARTKLTRIFPKLARWQVKVCGEAHGKQVLVNRFGELKRFYEVYVPGKAGEWKAGPQATEAIRFYPETEAAGWMREVVGRMAGAEEMKGCCLIARDLVMFEVEEGEVWEHVARFREVIERGGGIGVTPRIRCFSGTNMRSMQAIKVS
jgi:uracil-DNA glycosylase family 4